MLKQNYIRHFPHDPMKNSRVVQISTSVNKHTQISLIIFQVFFNQPGSLQINRQRPKTRHDFSLTDDIRATGNACIVPPSGIVSGGASMSRGVGGGLCLLMEIKNIIECHLHYDITVGLIMIQ